MRSFEAIMFDLKIMTVGYSFYERTVMFALSSLALISNIILDFQRRTF